MPANGCAERAQSPRELTRSPGAPSPLSTVHCPKASLANFAQSGTLVGHDHVKDGGGGEGDTSPRLINPGRRAGRSIPTRRARLQGAAHRSARPGCAPRSWHAILRRPLSISCLGPPVASRAACRLPRMQAPRAEVESAQRLGKADEAISKHRAWCHKGQAMTLRLEESGTTDPAVDVAVLARPYGECFSAKRHEGNAHRIATQGSLILDASAECCWAEHQRECIELFIKTFESTPAPKIRQMPTAASCCIW